MNNNIYKGQRLILPMDKWISDNVVKCECGIIVTGNSKKHTESNLKVHKKSKLHKKNRGYND